MKVLGFLNLHHSPELGPLTTRRTIASTSFLGRYAFMDFMLSNFSNSGIDSVGILVNQHPRSILKHLGSRNTFNVNTKTGFEVIAYNEVGVKRGIKYNNDIANIRVNDWIIKQAQPDYVVIAPSHYIYPIDFSKVIKQHIETKAEITAVYTNCEDSKNHFIGSDVFALSTDRLVKKIISNKGAFPAAYIGLETYVISRAKFEKLLREAKLISPFFSLSDIIAFKIENGDKVHSYEYKGYVRGFDSIEHYFKYSFELLDWKIRSQLFLPHWPIYTVTHDTPPAKYGSDINVNNSFIANGCLIEGDVTNSILSRNVRIKKGSKVDKSIIFTDSIIGENVKIEYAIVDKQVKVTKIKEVIGNEINFAYIKQGDEV